MSIRTSYTPTCRQTMMYTLSDTPSLSHCMLYVSVSTMALFTFLDIEHAYHEIYVHYFPNIYIMSYLNTLYYMFQVFSCRD